MGLKDLTKESIFNILIHSNKFNINLKSANILDLFSGVGSFGIECLSRGANYVIFAEKYIKKTQKINVKISNKYKIVQKMHFFLHLFAKFRPPVPGVCLGFVWPFWAPGGPFRAPGARKPQKIKKLLEVAPRYPGSLCSMAAKRSLGDEGGTT